MSGYLRETLGLFELGHLKPIAVPPSRRRVIPSVAADEIIRSASLRTSDSVIAFTLFVRDKKRVRWIV